MTKTLRNRPVDRAWSLATTPAVTDSFDSEVSEIFTEKHIREIIDSGMLPDLIEETRRTERAAREVRHWFESLAGVVDERRCPCGAVLRGRADQRYCSAACRVRAHRAR